MNLSGQAKTVIEIQDQSILRNTGIKGIIGVVGPTERGPIGEPILVGSWIKFTQIFGGLQNDNIFPLLCRRALESGAKLRVSRLGHYTDITDASTLEGQAAWFNQDVDGSGQPGYHFQAKSLGTWGNKLKISITPSLNIAGTFKLVIELEGFPELTETFNDFKGNATTLSDISVIEFNNKSNLVNIVEIEAPLTEGVALFSTISSPSLIGTNPTSYTAQDYVGDSTQGNGIHAFDNIVDIFRIAAPAIADPIVDSALIAYVENRKDVRALLRTPVGLNEVGIQDYRNGTGSYSHQPYDSWRASITTGGLKINHPVTGEKIEIPEIGDVMGCYSRKDNQYAEWFSAAGPKRGLVRNALGVVYNLGSAARQLEADVIDTLGINPVIEHPSFGTVLWGNSTLQRANTLLKHDNVADLMVYLTRELKPLIESELFEPNDIETWKTIYRKVKGLMDSVVEGRGIWKYLYQGDQDIDNISQAQINNPDDVDKGIYVFHLFVAPKVAMKYLGVKVILTNSGVDFESLTV